MSVSYGSHRFAIQKELMCMSKLNEDSRYHIPKEPTQPVEDRIRQATQRELEKWSNDTVCFEMELCAISLLNADRPHRSHFRTLRMH